MLSIGLVYPLAISNENRVSDPYILFDILAAVIASSVGSDSGEASFKRKNMDRTMPCLGSSKLLLWRHCGTRANIYVVRLQIFGE